MSLALLVRAPLACPAFVPASPTGPVRHRTTATLAGRLNLEWARLCEAQSSGEALNRWAVAQPVLAGARSLEDLRARVGCDDVEARDAVLLALLELAQGGDQLAGRTVLQAMLGKAVRVGNAVAGRPDMHGDREEAVSVAVAALWQVIATYPVLARPSRVAANLALDTVALVQRGHTGSSFFRRTFPEMPVADLRTVGEAYTTTSVRTSRQDPRTRSCTCCWPGVFAPGCWTWTRPGCWLACTPSTRTVYRSTAASSPTRRASPGRRCVNVATGWRIDWGQPQPTQGPVLAQAAPPGRWPHRPPQAAAVPTHPMPVFPPSADLRLLLTAHFGTALSADGPRTTVAHPDRYEEEPTYPHCPCSQQRLVSPPRPPSRCFEHERHVQQPRLRRGRVERGPGI